MKRAHAVLIAASVPLVALVATQACAQFSAGDCTDKAVCDSSEASTPDGGGPVDVNIDTVVKPDGDVPDGECNAGIEDCANGKDDNCNGLVDCDDPVCQSAGYVCTAAVPTGWSGPVALATLAGGNFPACSGAYATPAQQGHDGLNASPAQCGCACGGPTNVQCSTGIGITYYTDNGCNNVYTSASLPTVGFCVSNGDPSVVSAKGDTEPTSYNGDCTSTPSKNVPATSWTNSYTACGYNAPTDTGGCMNGAQCVQSPTAGKPCIYQVGSVACPTTPSPYTKQTLVFTSIDDSRSCATCTCTASAGTCSGSISAYAMGGCGGAAVSSFTTNGSCNAAPAARSAVATAVTTSAGTCGNSGTGGPIGDAGGASPVTVCCTP